MRIRLRPLLLVSLVVLSTTAVAGQADQKKGKPDPAMIAARLKFFGPEFGKLPWSTPRLEEAVP